MVVPELSFKSGGVLINTESEKLILEYRVVVHVDDSKAANIVELFNQYRQAIKQEAVYRNIVTRLSEPSFK